MKVKIYVEGGGDSDDIKTLCRRGFAKFFEKLLPAKIKVKVVACGSRSSAYHDFVVALTSGDNEYYPLLLVDSEEPVAADSDLWQHLLLRDKWNKPDGCKDDQAHLMVQCMESWFITDIDAMKRHYGGNFDFEKLPKLVNGNVEGISKATINSSLKSATKPTKAEEYHKTRDGFKLLELVDPNAVCNASAYAEKLRLALIKLLAAKKPL